MDWSQMLIEAKRTGDLALLARAEKARDKEYAKSQAAEDIFMFYWNGRKRTKSLHEARVWVTRIHDGLDLPGIPPAVINPGEFVWEVFPHWAAYYVPETKAIMVKTERIALDLLLHELAHHVCAVTGTWDDGQHRKAFLKAEDRIFNFLEKSGPKILRM